MGRWITLAGATLAGAVAGGLLMISLPIAGQAPEVSMGPQPPGPEHRTSKAEVTTLLAWTPGGMPEGFAGRVRQIVSVHAVAEVASGVIWVESWQGEGNEPMRAPEGMGVPVEVAAVDPKHYVQFVPPVERSRFLLLDQPMRTLLSATGARLRGIDMQGLLQAGDAELFAHGVVPDELIGAHEAVVSRDTGRQLGVTTPRYLLISLAKGTSRIDVEEELLEVLEPGTRLRVRAPGETPVFRHGDAVLPPMELKSLFGEFAASPRPDGSIVIDPEWLDGNIVTAEMPLLGTVSCHRQVLPQLTAALDELQRRGLGELVAADDFGGCFSGRFLNRNPGAGLSHHSWGVAIDLNVSTNQFGEIPVQDPRLVETLQRWGFTWGGDWLAPDGMHFEFLRWPLGPKG